MANRSTHTPSPTRIMFFGILTAFLMMSYQNCGKSGGKNMSATSVSTIQTEINPPVAHMNQAKTFNIYVPDESGATTSNYYTVNLANNTVQKFFVVDGANVTGNFCISQSWQAQLSALMNNSYICKEIYNVAPDQLCTENITYPYTDVSIGNQEYALGGTTTSCPSTSFDICQDQLITYRQVLNQFLAEIENTNCPAQ